MSDDAPLVRAVTPRWQSRRQIAAGIALALALPLWVTRNLVSDRLFVAATERAATEEAYQIYVREGWLSVASMADALPRVAFEEARRKKAPEALRSFLEKYGTSAFAAEARRALAATYVDARTKYRQQSATADARGRAAVERLIDSLLTSGVNSLAVEGIAPKPAAIKAADLRARLNYEFRRGVDLVLMSNWVRPMSAALSEQVARRLGAGFAEVFSPALLTVRAVGPTTASIPRESRIMVEYAVNPSGTFFSLGRTRDYVGLTVSLHTRLLIEGTEPVLDLSFVVPPGPGYHPSQSLSMEMLNTGTADVYTPMLNHAFEMAAPQFAALFFDRSSAAFRRASLVERSAK